MIVCDVSAVTVDDIIQTELEEAKLGNVIENVHANKRKSANSVVPWDINLQVMQEIAN